MSLIPDREALPHTLQHPRLCYFGILCGHVWIWDACHLASAAHPQMTLTVTIYISLTLFTLGLTIGALLAKPTSKTLSWINWPLATLMALGTLALVLPLPQGLPAEQILQAAAVFCGIGMGWTYMQWSFFYAALETRDALACIFGAMLIGSIIKIDSTDITDDRLDQIADLVATGHSFQADTIADLAEQIAVDPATLEETIDGYNAVIDAGEDLMVDPGKKLLGDKVEDGPFYASKRIPTIHYTMGGLAINTNAQVTKEDGTPIANLFAAGECTGGVQGGNRLGGNSFTDIIVFGRIAGQSAAANALA